MACERQPPPPRYVPPNLAYDRLIRELNDRRDAVRRENAKRGVKP